MKFWILLLFILANSTCYAEPSIQAPVPVTYILTSTLLAALVSAGVSAYIAVRLKDKEYRNDYYKKVIDKRMQALEKAEELISLFTVVHGGNDSHGDFHTYLTDELDSNKVLEAIYAVSKHAVWYSREINVSTSQFSGFILGIIETAKEIRDKEGLEGLKIYAAGERKEISEAINYIARSIGTDMRHLYDVDSFFKAKLGIIF